MDTIPHTFILKLVEVLAIAKAVLLECFLEWDITTPHLATKHKSAIGQLLQLSGHS
ncbi:hypothetical protein Q4603_09640 [Zobellia galactanivorans]|uniref:hypothetical protein n=1 Tax=Zobellia galactanivorans (strain DSM 12802 / CCUG 47099 / CIP 106680 / NCIMB 13871 / Dsij) TaxID=63186 RepID=UPI0026E1D63D|nr:hypothetical protein [Zobellia galactanivorans]MDO6808874.1 hypothetical protein [Zobellia galactanivorans]